MPQCEICKNDLGTKNPFCEYCGSPVPGLASKSPDPATNTTLTNSPDTPTNTPSATNTPDSSTNTTTTIKEETTPPVTKTGLLIFPDDSKIVIDDSQRLVGRVNLKEFSKDDLNLISRGHFTVFRDNGIFYIADGSTNVQEKPSEHHTLINDSDITNNGPKELSDGDVVKISDVQMRFQLE